MSLVACRRTGGVGASPTFRTLFLGATRCVILPGLSTALCPRSLCQIRLGTSPSLLTCLNDADQPIARTLAISSGFGSSAIAVRVASSRAKSATDGPSAAWIAAKSTAKRGRCSAKLSDVLEADSREKHDSERERDCERKDPKYDEPLREPLPRELFRERSTADSAKLPSRWRGWAGVARGSCRGSCGFAAIAPRSWASVAAALSACSTSG
mmetsp:Transcript_27907/g.47756  ORF Transcript_27907/g.47756 Transcript_27907/m.47756 type:complete len:211 (-) Transcript_27907:287-919(-)